jgi:hypothetical protein
VNFRVAGLQLKERAMAEESWAKRNLVWLVLGGVFLVILPVCACVIFGTLFYVVKSTASPGGPGVFGMGAMPAPITQVFYYDIITGKLFAADTAEFAPIETPDKSRLANGEPAGVKANVFSCGKCREDEWYIGYLETYLPGAKAAQIKMNEETERMAKLPPASGSTSGSGSAVFMGPSPQEMMAISQGHLVASHEAVDKWYKQESPEGAALVNAAMKKCPDGKYPMQCFPGR